MSRGSRLVAVAALVDIVVVCSVWASMRSHGPLSLVAGVVLAPLAVLGVRSAAARLAGAHFGVAAAFTYAALPLGGIAYVNGPYRSTFVHDALPEVLGLRQPGWLALGVALALLLTFAPQTVLAASGAAAAAVSLAVWGVHPLTDVRNGLHETAWSITMLEWVAIAGVAGVARRSARLAVATGGWLWFFVLRAADAGYDHTAFWRSLAVAAPMIAVLVSSLWLLVPRLRPAAARAPSRSG